MLVTDGEPADIDERDPQHLRHDTKKAVDELASKGVLTYCLTLDPNADTYVKRIFGDNHYTIVDHVDRLFFFDDDVLKLFNKLIICHNNTNMFGWIVLLYERRT